MRPRGGNPSESSQTSELGVPIAWASALLRGMVLVPASLSEKEELGEQCIDGPAFCCSELAEEAVPNNSDSSFHCQSISGAYRGFTSLLGLAGHSRFPVDSERCC